MGILNRLTVGMTAAALVATPVLAQARDARVNPAQKLSLGMNVKGARAGAPMKEQNDVFGLGLLGLLALGAAAAAAIAVAVVVADDSSSS